MSRSFIIEHLQLKNVPSLLNTESFYGRQTQLDVCVPHTHILFCSLQTHTVGSWEGGQSTVLSQLLSGVLQLSTPSRAHTVCLQEKKGPSASSALGPHSCVPPRQSHGWLVSVSRREPHILGHLNLHDEDDIGDVGLGRRWRADITKTQSETSIRVLSGQNIPRRIPPP